MRDLADEFLEISERYRRLEKELAVLLGQSDSQSSRELTGAILRNRDCLARIDQMNSAVLRLSDQWKKSRARLDSTSREKIDDLAEKACAHATRMHQLCSNYIQKLQDAKDKLQRDLADLGKGLRYLKNVQPVKHNYPKFIDSMY